ncbi:inorganic diphosphatase [Sphingomicrobium nitratireducens]|uniref:inorganic diphosphatase n=1 Tax=Sphingomicrobium nitratireducens TaxID=2964666 RepID=UPI002240A2F6|nr:inorganic diphosphatase [Sphingomicrobium nitratireducens]
MKLDLIPPGKNPPESLNVFIEVPIGGEPVKYEFDKASETIFVDRILHTPMRYPCNYGFIPQTLCDDGDPLDCLVMSRWALLPGTVIAARPVGVLHLEDEAGGDEKLLAVPVTKVSPYYKDVEDYTDLPPIVVEQIEHFFTHYKDLEKEKWVRIGRWGGREDAYQVVRDAIAKADKKA